MRNRRSQCAQRVPHTPVSSSNKFQLAPFTESVVIENAVNILSRVQRLYETGFGLTIGFIGLNSITQLVITPYSSL
jgi:hypothetical protein